MTIARIRSIERLLARAEPRIGLLGRCQPYDAARERRRLLEQHARGAPLTPGYRHAPPPDLTQLKRELGLAARSLESGDELDQLYARRCLELELEAELAERVGQAGFAALARRRFVLASDADGERAAALAASWSEPTIIEAPSEPTYQSDDASEPRSLLACLTRRLGQLRLACRLVIDPRLTAIAATGDGIIHLRGGVPLTSRQAERITAHEIEAHALPRERARWQTLGLLRVGSAGAVEDEEGRALLIEERGGWLDAERRRTLGLRHLCGLALAHGADWTECMRLLERRGCTPEAALALIERVGRGGGLCRELVYLPAWVRVSRVLAREPELESWLERGRLSLDAARLLAASPPPRV